MHGFTKKMFDRQHWYPLIGFQELIFREELSTKLKGVCGSAFPGNCDTEVASYIGDLIAARRSQRLFIYWMTLTAHLPVDDKTAASSQFPCQRSATWSGFSLKPTRRLPSWYCARIFRR